MMSFGKFFSYRTKVCQFFINECINFAQKIPYLFYALIENQIFAAVYICFRAVLYSSYMRK